MPKRRPSPPGPRVLLVGDAHFHQGLVAVVLRRLGYRVEWRASGGEALSLLARQAQGLVLTALRLPDLDGLEFIKRVKARGGAWASCPCLVTGDEDEVESRKADLERAAISGWFAKPAPIARMLDEIRLLTRGAMNDSVASAETPDVDLERLTSFTGGDAALEAELVDLFLATARRYIEEMRDALDAERPWTHQAHALKGASANIGAPALAGLAQEAEKQGGDDALLEQLERRLDAVERFFADRVANPTSIA